MGLEGMRGLMTSTSWLAPALGLLSPAPHAHGPFSVFRKTGQGAGAGLLGLAGAGAFGGQSAPPAAASTPFDLSSIDSVFAALMSGAFNGPLQILGAVLIFAAAGRCIARMFGLGIVLLGFVAWQQGMRWDDLLPALQEFWARATAAYAAFMATPAAGG